MKKLMLLMVVAAGLSVANVNAQTEKGTFLLGGGAAFQTSDGNSDFQLNPNLGYFFFNNFAAGARLNLYFTDGYNSWDLGPLPVTTLVPKQTVSFFGQASLNVGGAKNTDTDLGLGIGAGYAFFLNKSIALETAAYYDKTGESKGRFTIGIGFQIHLKR